MPHTSPAPLLVTCLCAQWCGTCRDYRATFERVARDFPDAQFRWVDIEDEADLVDPVEVENFPTVLISRAADPLFFGTITPQPETLARIIEAMHQQSSASAALNQDPGLTQLTRALAQAR